MHIQYDLFQTQRTRHQHTVFHVNADKLDEMKIFQ